MAHLYLNENFPLPVVQALRNLGHDVVTVQEAGNADQAIPDDEVLAFATAESRVVLTLNRRDFIHLHKTQPNHAGIIVCTYDADFIGQARRIHEAITTQPVLEGQLIRVNRPQK
jgi:hypothetical protein